MYPFQAEEILMIKFFAIKNNKFENYDINGKTDFRKPVKTVKT